MMKLAIKKNIDLREVWKHEALDFTEWLSKEENLARLSETVGIKIEFLEKQHQTGSFYADILAIRPDTNQKIIIENQLSIIDHDHLGKVITYAAGCEAEIIIWVVKDIKDEHKQAVDWLNEHSDDSINIIVVKVEVIQIADSPYAPVFSILARPNEWKRIVSRSVAPSTKTQMKRLDFWTALNDFLASKKSQIKPQKPNSNHWNNVSIGTSTAYLAFRALFQDKKITCDFYIPDDKELYNKLLDNKVEIEKAVGNKLIWQECEKNCLISIEKGSIDLNDGTTWNDCFDWLEHYSILFKRVFKKYVPKIRL